MPGPEGPVTVSEARGILAALRRLLHAPDLTAGMGCAIAGGTTLVAIAFTGVLIYIAMQTLGPGSGDSGEATGSSAQSGPTSSGQAGSETSDTASSEPAEQLPEEPESYSADWNISIEINGEWQGGVVLRLEGTSTEGEAMLDVEPAAYGTYTLDKDGILTVQLTREYPVDTASGTVMVPEAITIDAAVILDMHLEGSMGRDNWMVYDDGSMEDLGALTYPLQGNLR